MQGTYMFAASGENGGGTVSGGMPPGGAGDGEGGGDGRGGSRMMSLSDVMGGLAKREPIAIEGLSIASLEGRLREPFVIASDSSKMELVDNLIITIRTADGFVGLGEGAHFAGIAGDSFDILKSDVRSALHELWGRRMAPLNFISALNDVVKWPAARAALEMAYLDAQARREALSLFTFLDPQATKRDLVTDVTIPIVEGGAAFALAGSWRARGFTRIKVKVGDDVTAAVDRTEAVVKAFEETGEAGELELLLDANGGYNADSAVLLLWHLKNRTGISPSIFEQPVKRRDLDGMRHVREVAQEYGTRVYADESVFTMRDALDLIEADAADGVNLKLMKHGGIVESYRIGEVASAAGLEIMIGGMVESKLAMTASLHLAQLLDVDWLDLDTPLLMDVRGLAGGMIYRGARVSLPDSPGIGVNRIESV